jgi:hypothetical protein
MKKHKICTMLTLLFTLSCSGGGGMGSFDFDNATTQTPPSPPNLGETYISVWPISGSEIQMSFGAQKGSYEIAYYELYRDSVLIGPIASDGWTDAQLGYGSTYCYRVVAVDSGGNRSPDGGSGCATTGWKSEAVDSSPGPAQLQMHQDNSPRLAYIADEGVRTAVKRNSVWEIETASNIESFFDDFSDNALYTGPYVTSLSLTIDSSDNARIFYNLFEYVNDRKYSLWNVSQNGLLWNAQRICFDCTWDDTFDAVLDNSNNAHISYFQRQYNNYQSSGLGYAYESTPNAWNFDIIDSDDSSGLISSIAIDHSEKVNIVYYDLENYTIKYLNNIQGNWVSSIIDGPFTNSPFTNSLLDTVISSAIDSNDKLHLIYYNPDSGFLVYANNTSGSWTTDIIDNEASGSGRLNSIALGADNSVHTAYNRSSVSAVNRWSHNGLEYATNKNGSWSKIHIASTGIESPSITLDSNDNVHISYIGINTVTAPEGLPGRSTRSEVRYVMQIPY